MLFHCHFVTSDYDVQFIFCVIFAPYQPDSYNNFLDDKKYIFFTDFIFSTLYDAYVVFAFNVVFLNKKYSKNIIQKLKIDMNNKGLKY